MLERGLLSLKKRVPRRMWQRFRRHFLHRKDSIPEKPLQEATCRQLLADPEAFLEALRAEVR